LQATKPHYDKYVKETLRTYKNDLTDLGEEAINKHIWKCYLPSSVMGKNREINSIEATSLLENVKHIDDIHLIQYYKNMPMKKLEDTFITIVFSNYENDEITERLQKALYIKSIMKKAAKNGSIDALNQEVKFKKALKDDENVTDYIARISKHPFVSFLGVNLRTLQSFGGNKNAKK